MLKCMSKSFMASKLKIWITKLIDMKLLVIHFKIL